MRTKILAVQSSFDPKMYTVVKLVNRTEPEIGSELTREKINTYMTNNCTVEIIGDKRGN